MNIELTALMAGVLGLILAGLLWLQAELPQALDSINWTFEFQETGIEAKWLDATGKEISR
jgi:hypothetical protein